jgi:hypothetical protein
LSGVPAELHAMVLELSQDTFVQRLHMHIGCT